MRSAGVLLAGFLAASCSGKVPSPEASSVGPLPPGVVARVGSTVIRAEEVARVATAQRSEVARAREALVRDTLLAQHASTSGLADSADVRLAVRGALARQVLGRALASARIAPPTEVELAAAYGRKWLEVDRPEGFRTVHLVVRFEPTADAQLKQSGMRLAEEMRSALRPVADRVAEFPLPENQGAPMRALAEDRDPLSGAFQTAAKALPHEGFEVTVQPLPPVSADGRVLFPNGGSFDPDFAKAAASLARRGDLSPVSVTPFGAHVIMLLERLPPSDFSEAERNAKLRDDIVNDRARAAEKQLLIRLRDRRTVAPDTDALLALIAIDQ